MVVGSTYHIHCNTSGNPLIAYNVRHALPRPLNTHAATSSLASNQCTGCDTSTFPHDPNQKALVFPFDFRLLPSVLCDLLLSGYIAKEN